MEPPSQTPRKLGGVAGSTAHETPFRTPHRTPGGEQMSATPVVDFEAIEAQKENVKPLARGRSAHALTATLSMQHKERKPALLEQRKQFEEQISSAATAESDDPLDIWNEYVKWAVNKYPSGQSAESGLVPLLERATRTFRDSEQYRNDSRYLRFWILYARNVECPRDVYNFLLANELGTQLAGLYEELAVVLEGSGIFDEADSMYRLGIARSAQPLDRIKRHYQEFQQRIMLTPFEGSSSTGEQLTYQSALKAAMGKAGRSMLGLTTTSGAGKQSFSHNSLRGLGFTTGAAGIPTSKVATDDNRGKLAVFRDDDDEPHAATASAPWAEFGTSERRHQENAQRVDKMNGSHLPQSHGIVIRTPGRTLNVCRDSDSDEDAPRSVSGRKATKAITVLQQPQSETDLLRKNPFMHWGPDAKLKPDETDITPPPTQLTSKKVRPKTVLGSRIINATGKCGDKGRDKVREHKSKEGSSGSKVRSASKGKVSSSRSSAAPRGPSRYVFSILLLYPGLSDPQDTPPSLYDSKEHAQEVCIEEIMAHNRGVALGDAASDQWSHLDGLERQWLPVFTTSPTHASEIDSPPERDHYDPPDSVANAEALNMRQAAKPAVARPPSPTLVTKATMLEVAGMFNGDDDDSDESSSSSSSEDEDDGLPSFSVKAISRRPNIPETPTPIGRSLSSTHSSKLATVHDENAAPRNLARPTAVKPVIPVRAPLGMATPMRPAFGLRRPLALAPIAPAEGKDEGEEEEEVEQDKAGSTDDLQVKSSHVLARRVSPTEDENDESDPDEEYDQQLYEEEHDNVGLSPITERTEFTRFTSARTPLSSRGSRGGEFSASGARTLSSNDLGGRSRLGAHIVEELSFDSSASVGVLENDTAHQGRPDLDIPHGLTIRQADDTNTDELNAEQHGSDQDAVGVLPNPCAPTDPAVIEYVLSSQEQPIEASSDHFNLSHLNSGGKLEALQKRAKSMMRRSVGNTSSASVAKDWHLDIDGLAFEVRSKLGEGGYGAVFLAEDIQEAIPRRAHALQDSRVSAPSIDDEEDDQEEAQRRRLVAIKVETPPNKWEFYILVQLRSRLSPRLLPSIVSARRFYSYADESFLILEYGDKGTLLEVVNHASTANVAPTGLAGNSGVDETLAMFFVIELLRLLEGLHDAGLLHGDVKIDNCLLRLGETRELHATYSSSGANQWSTMGLTLIDFGRAVDLANLPAGQQCCADWEPDLRDCPEMREGRPWTHQADYFGAAGVAHCLLFGKYIETVTDEQGRYKVAAPFRRYWQMDLWTRLFDILLNSTSVKVCGELPITEEVGAIRKEMESWLEANCNRAGRNLKGLLRRLQIWKLN